MYWRLPLDDSSASGDRHGSDFESRNTLAQLTAGLDAAFPQGHGLAQNPLLVYNFRGWWWPLTRREPPPEVFDAGGTVFSRTWA